MDISVSIPLDADGFLRRECPTCEQQFKCFSGDTEDKPHDVEDPTIYFCPYCGLSAPIDHWWTQEQLNYATGTAAGPIMEQVEDEMRKALSGLSSGLINVTVGSVEASPLPAPPHEANDMILVEAPCHSYEPIKIVDSWDQPVHCLVCGQRFLV